MSRTELAVECFERYAGVAVFHILQGCRHDGWT
jgi:hypothetical protein